MSCCGCICSSLCSICFFFFFFNDTATTEIYTLSLHDALPIYLVGGDGPAQWRRPRQDRPRGRALSPAGPRGRSARGGAGGAVPVLGPCKLRDRGRLDRKSTRLNSSHSQISYAVFCLKKKKQNNVIPE